MTVGSALYRYILFLFRMIITGWGLFVLQKILFILFYFRQFTFSDALLVVANGVRLDLATVAYFTLLPAVLGLLFFFIHSDAGLRALNRSILVLTTLFYFISILIHSGEIVTYREWGSKLTTKVFIHLEKPVEVLRSASFGYSLLFLGLVLIQALFIYFIYYRLFRKNTLSPVTGTIWKKGAGLTLMFFLVVPGEVIVARGGFNGIPIGLRDAYFSDNHVLNDASSNSAWNFFRNWALYTSSPLDEVFGHLPDEEILPVVDSLFRHVDSAHVQVLEEDMKLNLIFFILEGWAPPLIGVLGGEPGITPNFNRLSEEGILFTNFFATSRHSETGNASIFSGLPTIDGIKLTNEPDKARKLPGILNSLPDHHSLMLFGGSLSYGDIGAYYHNAGFDRVIDESNVVLDPRGSLGAHDEATIPYLMKLVKEARQPFLYGLFTQSTHAPYDFPGNREVFVLADSAYKNSMRYADHHLGLFFEELKETDLYHNTLVVLVADHTKAYAEAKDPYQKKGYHIPALIWGGPVKEEYRGMKVDRIGSQADLAKTLLLQLNLPADHLLWGKDLFNPSYPEFATFAINGAYGWIDSKGYFTYSFTDHIFHAKEFSTEEDFLLAKKTCDAFLHYVYNGYTGL